MKSYKRRKSIIEGFEVVKEFAWTVENGQFEDRSAAAAFVDVARHALEFVEQIDGRRSLSRVDLACAVAMLARATDQTWREDLKRMATTARKLEKQLGKMVQKQDPFFFEASFEQ
jgi:hypothetical protein